MKHLIIALLLALSQSTEAGEFKLGWKSNPKHSKGLRQVVHDPRFGSAPLPPAATVRPDCRPIYDQLDIGSCTANAGLGGYDFAWKKSHGRFGAFSRLDLYQQSLQHDGNFPEDAGSYTTTVIWVLKNSGVCRESQWPYKPEKLAILPPPKAVAGRTGHAAIKAYDVPNNDGGYAVMQCIANIKRPVLTGGYVFNSIFSPLFDKATGKWYVPMPSGRPVGGHEVLIVSYDNNLTIAGIKGWVEIANSWGKGYGDKGFVWLPAKYILNPKYFEDNAVIEITQ